MSYALSLSKDMTLNSLGDDLLMEILCRLPNHKCVVRCQSVCKRWSNLIVVSNYLIERFISHHYQCNANSNPSAYFTLLAQIRNVSNPSMFDYYILSPNKIDWGDYCDVASSHEFDFSYSTWHHLASQNGIPKRLNVIGSYNDLLLCNSWNNGIQTLYICNYQTKKSIQLPPRDGTTTCYKTLKVLAANLICEPYYSVNAAATAVRVNADYRYWVVFLSTKSYSETNEFTVHIYSSKAGKWVNFDFKSPKYIRFTIAGPSTLSYNNMIYFYDYIDRNGNGMIAIDPSMAYNQNTDVDANNILGCHFVEWPEPVQHPPRHGFVATKMGICLGKLRLCRSDISYSSLWIWDLKDYSRSEWSWQYKIVLKQLYCVPCVPCVGVTVKKVLGFHPFCRDMLFLQMEDHIVLYHLKTMRPVLEYPTHAHKYPLQSWIFPQWWPTPLVKCHQ